MSGKALPSIRHLAGLIAAASLLACAAPPGGQDQAQEQSGQSASTTAEGASGSSYAQGGIAGTAATGSHAGCGMAGDSAAGMQTGCAMQPMNRESMCTMYRSMREAPNEQARRAIMDQRMQGMSPEMRQRHLEMMQQQCQ